MLVIGCVKLRLVRECYVHIFSPLQDVKNVSFFLGQTMGLSLKPQGGACIKYGYVKERENVSLRGVIFLNYALVRFFSK